MGLAEGAPVHAAGIAGVGGGAFKSPEHFLELLLLVLRALHESRPCLGVTGDQKNTSALLDLQLATEPLIVQTFVLVESA